MKVWLANQRKAANVFSLHRPRGDKLPFFCYLSIVASREERIQVIASYQHIIMSLSSSSPSSILPHPSSTIFTPRWLFLSSVSVAFSLHTWPVVLMGVCWSRRGGARLVEIMLGDDGGRDDGEEEDDDDDDFVNKLKITRNLRLVAGLAPASFAEVETWNQGFKYDYIHIRVVYLK